MNKKARLKSFLERPEAKRVRQNAHDKFRFDLPHPVPDFGVTCTMCEAAGREPADDLQLSSVHVKKNDDKQFVFWMDTMFKCCQCSNVEAFGEIPITEERFMDVLREHNSFRVQWRDALADNLDYLTGGQLDAETSP